MNKKPASSIKQVKKPPSRGNQSLSSNQPPSSVQRPKYVPPISTNKDKKIQTVSKQSLVNFKSKDEQIYLSSHGYVRTVQSLRRQKPLNRVGQINSNSLANRRKQTANNTSNINAQKHEQQQKMLIKYFQKGQRQQFFKLTNKWFTLSDPNSAKLQFQIQIYFCIFNVHPNNNKAATTIQKPYLQAFRKYLQTRGNQLANQQQYGQYLPYFSLPYIPKPQQNPAFNYLFSKQYVNKLKQKVSDFIKQYHQKQTSQSNNPSNYQSRMNNQPKKCCQLEQIFDRYQQEKQSLVIGQQKQQNSLQRVHATVGIRSRIKQAKQKQIKQFKSFKESKQYQEVANQIKVLKQKLIEANQHRQYALNYVQKLSSNLKELGQSSKVNLLESNKKWFMFAKDIIVMVKKATRQHNIKIEGFQKFEGFFGKNIEQVINNADVSIFDKGSMTEDYSMVGENRSKNINDRSNLMGNGQKMRQQTSSQIDMIKIQSLFANAQDPERQMQILLLLKALKNRFSKCKNPFAKRQVVVQYSRHDICGITPQKYYIQKKLLVEGSQRIRQFYLRLTNNIAYDLYGIHYLIKSQKLIQNLMNILRQQILEQTNSKKFILAILQRFSYPIKSRRKMVQFGIVPLIFKIFESQKQSISLYTLQYLTAMIMNLSLKKDCQKHFIPYKQQLITIMIELMCHQSDQIRNYVNGALFLLLSYKDLMIEAKKQHLEERIIQMLEDYDENQVPEQNLESSKYSQNRDIKSDEQRQKHFHTSRKLQSHQLQQQIQLQQQQQQAAQSSIKVQYNYILKKLRGQIQIDPEQSDQQQQDQNIQIDQFQEEQEQDEQQDDEENNQSDFIEGEEDYLNGDELLLKQFTLLGPQALKEQLLTRSVLDETAKRINNMTLSMNRSKRLDNIFAPKEKGSQQLILQPQFQKLLGQENINISREDLLIKRKK